MAYTYMLRCCDGSLYTGWTNDLVKRDAMRREYQIKQLTRKEKEALIAALPDDILQQIEAINTQLPSQD